MTLRTPDSCKIIHFNRLIYRGPYIISIQFLSKTSSDCQRSTEIGGANSDIELLDQLYNGLLMADRKYNVIRYAVDDLFDLISKEVTT